MKKLILILFGAVLSIAALAQETNCGNGIDDDGDGFIDCFDSNCAANSACDGFYFGNDYVCQAPPTEFPKFSMKRKWGSANATTNHLNRASVGDLNRDGIPEVVVTEIEGDFIYILDGKTGNTTRRSSAISGLSREIVIGNLDNDACGDIFIYYSRSGFFIQRYDCNLNLVWTSPALSAEPMQFGLADFDNDGKVELYSRDEILDAHTGIRIVRGTASNDRDGGPLAVDILNNDNKLELISGCKIYSVNLGTRASNVGSLTLLQSRTEYHIRKSHSATSVVDFNQDGSLDVIASGSNGSKDNNTTIFFWDVKNNTLKTYIERISTDVTIAGCSGSTGKFYQNGWQTGTGRVNVADIDGDGNLNAVYVSGKYLYALDHNFNKLWRVTINEETSGYTGCTVYDFNGDGAAEVVYRDENFLYIINGNDGSVNTQQACVARTNVEYPIVADIDGDGSTELCVTCGFDDNLALANFCNLGYSRNSHVRVFESAAEPWVPSRKLWNQHGYFNVNVNDDLTIPRLQQKHHLIWSTGNCTTGPNRALNSFLNQTPYLDATGCPSYASPDLVHVQTALQIQQPTCPSQNFTISLGIMNQGDVRINATVPVTFYSGNPQLAGAVKLNTVNLPVNLNVGQQQTFTNVTVTGTGGNFTLYIALNDAGTSGASPITLPNSNILECNYDNFLSVPIRPGTVPISAVKESDNVKCLGASVPDNGAVRAFVLNGAVENTADYDFFWFNGTTVDATPDYTGAVYSGLPAGTYTVYGLHKTAACNTDTTSVTITRVDKLMTAGIIVDKPNTSCDDPNGQMRAQVNGGEDPTKFTFKWYEGNDIFTSPEVAVGVTASNLKGGITYTVLATDNSSGCQAVASLSVPNNTPGAAAVDEVITDAKCVPANSGSISATSGGGTAGVNFYWYNGSAVKPTADHTGSTYSSLVPGFYTVVAEVDSSKCKSPAATFEVKVAPGFVVTPSVVDPQTSCDVTTPNGEVTANVGGTTSGYTFEWFRGQSILAADAVSNPAALASGTYTVKATKISTGCTATEEILVPQNLLYPSVSLSATPNSICDATLASAAYNGSVTATVTYNSAVVTDFTNYSLVWRQGSSATDPIIAGATSASINQLVNGDYTLVVTRTDTKCAAAPETRNVGIATVLPVITSTQTGSTNCLPVTGNGSAQVTQVDGLAVGATTNFTYQWHTGTGIASPIVGQTSPVLNNLQGGATSNFTVLVTNKSTGCQNTKTELVADDKTLPVVTVTKIDNSICDPSLTTGGITYNGVVTATPTIGSIGQYTYAFSPAGGVQSTVIDNSYEQLNGGNYSVVATRTSTGCASAPTSIQVDNNVPVIALTTAQTGSSNCDLNLADGKARVTRIDNVNVAGIASQYTFLWEWDGTASPAFDVSANATNDDPELTNVQGGAGYKYKVTVTNKSNGCQATAVRQVNDKKKIPTLSLSSTDNSVCDPSLIVPPGAQYNGVVTATVTNQGGSPLSDYTFTFGGGQNVGVQGAFPTLHNTYTRLNGGAAAYTVNVKQTSTGCESTNSTIAVANNQSLPALVLSAVSSTNCNTVANGSALVSTIDGGPVPTSGYTFNWTGPTMPAFAVTPVANNSNTKNLIKVQGGTGYDYSVEVVDQSDGCKSTASINVGDAKVLPLLTLVPTPNTICDIAKATALATPAYDGKVEASITNIPSGSTINDYFFDWSAGTDGNGLDDLSGLDEGSYSVVATHNITGCVSSSYNAQVLSAEVRPMLGMSQTPAENCDGGTPDGVASVAVSSPVGRNYDYKWYDGNTVSGGTPDFSQLNATALSSNYSGVDGGINGTALFDYTVEVTVLQTGCQNTGTVGVDNNSEVPLLGALTKTDNQFCVGGNGTAAVSTVTYRGNVVSAPYTGFTFTWSNAATTSSISSLTAGSYSVTITNTSDNCVSNPVLTTVADNLFFPIINTAEVPQTSCDPLTPNGSLTASINETTIGGAASTTAGYTFSWVDDVTLGTTGSNAITARKGNQTYTLTATRTTTQCTTTQQYFLDEVLTIPTVVLGVTDLTRCAPANGALVATPSPAATYDYFWYNGSDAASENDVITNADFSALGIATVNSSYTSLTPGEYTVVVRNVSTKCKSLQKIETVDDNSPKFNLAAANLVVPSSCIATGGRIEGWVKVATSMDISFTGVSGSDVMTSGTPHSLSVGQRVIIDRSGVPTLPAGLLDDEIYFVESVLSGTQFKLEKTVGSGAISVTSNGSGVISRIDQAGYDFDWYNGVPSPTSLALGSINYFTNPPVYSGSTLQGGVNPIVNLTTGVYTVEARNTTTGCKTYLSHTLPFTEAQAVLKISKTDSEICPYTVGDGSVTLQIEVPPTALGGAANQLNYFVKLYRGTTLLANQISTLLPGDVPTDVVNPFLVDDDLAPASYIIEVRENFGSNCPIFQELIIQANAKDPVISLVSNTPNDACDLTAQNGSIVIGVDKASGDLVSPTATYDLAISPDPSGFSNTGLAAGNYTASDLDPATYTFTATASTGCSTTKSFTVLDNPATPVLTSADVTITKAQYCDATIEQSAAIVVNTVKLDDGTAEDIDDYRFDWFTNAGLTTNILTGMGDASSTKGREILSNVGAPLPSAKVTNGSYWVRITKINDTGNTGGVGCESPALSMVIAPDKVNPTVVLTPTGDTACNPTVFEGSIEVDATTASGPGVAAQYSYTWTPNGGAGQPTNTINQSGSSNVFGTINNASYSVAVLNQITRCETSTSVTVPKGQPPVFTVSATATALQDCNPAAFDGKIDNVSVVVDGAPGIVSHFDYVWYRNDLSTVVLNGQGVAPVDTELTLTTYPSIAVDEYFVKAIRKSGGAGIGCESAPVRRDILDTRVFPQVSLTSLPSTACNLNYDGSITVTATTASGKGATADYNFVWTSDPDGAGPNFSVANAMSSPSAYTTQTTDKIGQGAYALTVTNEITSCATNGNVIVQKNTVPVEVTSASALADTNCVTETGSVQVTGVRVGTGPIIVPPSVDFNFDWTGAGGPYNNVNQVTGLAKGIYQVVAEKIATTSQASGCFSAPFTVTVKEELVNPVVSFSTTPSTACDVNFHDGGIQVFATTTGFPATTNYNFAWTSNPANSTISGRVGVTSSQTFNSQALGGAAGQRIAPGTYGITVTNTSNNCPTNATVAVEQNSVPLEVTEAATLPQNHCTVADGSATLRTISLNGTNVSSPFTGYTMVWQDAGGSNVGNTATVNNLGFADYFVTVTRTAGASVTPAAGCESAPFRVTISDERVFPTIRFATTPNSSCDTNFDGSITVTPATASGPGVGALYSFDWTSDPDAGGAVYSIADVASASTITTTAADRVGAGTYQITVTNLNTQCASNGQTQVVDNPASLEILTATKNDQDICLPDGDITVATLNQGVPANYSFGWFRTSPTSTALVNGASVTITSSTLSTTNYPTMGAGTYFVVGTRTAGNPGSGCSTPAFRVDVLDKHIDPTIAAATTNVDVNCVGGAGAGSIVINEAFPANFVYQWFAGSNATLPTIGANSNTINNLQQGEYTVRVTENATGCFSIERYTIAEQPTAVTLDLSGLTIPPVTACDPATGIPLNGSVTINQILENGTPQGVGNFTFVWTDSLGTTILQTGASPTLNNRAPGYYLVEATHVVSNCKTDFAFELEDQTKGSVEVVLKSFESPERCIDPQTGFLIVEATGTGATYDFEWYNGDQRPSPSGVPVLVDTVFNNIAVAGTFTVKAINNTNGCWSVDAYDVELITNNIVLTATASPLTFCSSDNGEVFATIANDNKFEYDFDWSNLPATGPFDSDQSGLASGTYSVFAVDRLDAGCISNTATVVVNNLQEFPTVLAEMLRPVTRCVGDPDGVATSYVEIDLGGGATEKDIIHYTFDWFTGNPPVGASFYTGAEASGLGNQTGTTTYTVVATELITGCSGTATVDVVLGFAPVPLPTVEVVSQVTSCIETEPNGSVSASVNGVTKDYLFIWNTSPADTTDVLSNLPVGTYGVRATDKITGCVSDEVTGTLVLAQVFPDFDIAVEAGFCPLTPEELGQIGRPGFTPSDTSDFDRKQGGYATILTENVSQLDTIRWFDESGTVIGGGPNLFNVYKGTYSVEVYTTLGCMTARTFKIPSKILVYNAVSKQKDGLHDFFEIACIQDFPNNSVEIFNRAGSKVYTANGYDNDQVRFEGTSNHGLSPLGDGLPAGTYYFVIDKGDGSAKVVGYLELVD